MAFTFDPWEAAEQLLLDLGVEFDQVYNEEDGITREQLSILGALSSRVGTFEDQNTGKEVTIIDSAYKTIHRLHASANKANIDFAANVKNTLVGTVESAMMDTIDQKTTSKQKQQTIIKWIPSTAKEPDPFHALNYGKTMTLQDALNKGLGIRYGCKCSMQILQSPAKVEQEINKLNKI